MELSMDRVLMSMQIRTLIQDGGCSVESMAKAVTPIVATQHFLLENGKKTSLFKENGFSQLMVHTMKAPLQIISQQEMEFGISPMETWLQAIISKLLFQTKIQMIRRSTLSSSIKVMLGSLRLPGLLTPMKYSDCCRINILNLIIKIRHFS